MQNEIFCIEKFIFDSRSHVFLGSFSFENIIPEKFLPYFHILGSKRKRKERSVREKKRKLDIHSDREWNIFFLHLIHHRQRVISSILFVALISVPFAHFIFFILLLSSCLCNYTLPSFHYHNAALMLFYQSTLLSVDLIVHSALFRSWQYQKLPSRDHYQWPSSKPIERPIARTYQGLIKQTERAT